MSIEDPGDVSYNQVGGLGEQIRELREVCMSHGMRFPTMWYVRPAKAQTSLRIRAVLSEPLLVACIIYDC